MRRSIPLGRIAGIQIGANWTWLIIFALVAWSLAEGVFPNQNPGMSDGAYWTMAAIAALLFFGSIVLHELGHALQARRDGVAIEGITLWLFGGVAQFRGMYRSPGSEFRIAVAGPLVTLVLAGALIGGASVLPLPESVEAVVFWLGYINVVLLVFNLLPALPLDGGRVLHALLWRLRGDLARATHAAALIGVGFGSLMVAGGVLLFFASGAFGALWLALIGWFLSAAARAEAQDMVVRRALRGLQVRDVMSREPIAVPSEITLQAFVDEYAIDTTFTTYPVVERDRLVGLLPFDAVTAVPRADWSARKVRDVMMPRDQVTVLAPDRDAGEAVHELAGADVERAVVVEDDHLVGVVAPADLVRAVQTAGADQQAG
ncbi:MAG TPA: site-2 protease family protein [Solirubrobacteraceae bacterium]|nr:site-2 protease family protein [Solirubrobacteraceae bacterium]